MESVGELMPVKVANETDRLPPTEVTMAGLVGVEVDQVGIQTEVPEKVPAGGQGCWC